MTYEAILGIKLIIRQVATMPSGSRLTPPPLKLLELISGTVHCIVDLADPWQPLNQRTLDTWNGILWEIFSEFETNGDSKEAL